MGDMSIYGTVQEATRNEALAVGITSIVVAQPKQFLDQPRKVITIRNTSPNATDTITLNMGQNPAVASAGIVLKQNETVTDSMDGGYLPWQGTITGICATATGTLAIFER